MLYRSARMLALRELYKAQYRKGSMRTARPGSGRWL